MQQAKWKHSFKLAPILLVGLIVSGCQDPNSPTPTPPTTEEVAQVYSDRAQLFREFAQNALNSEDTSQAGVFFYVAGLFGKQLAEELNSESERRAANNDPTGARQASAAAARAARTASDDFKDSARQYEQQGDLDSAMDALQKSHDCKRNAHTYFSLAGDVDSANEIWREVLNVRGEMSDLLSRM